MHFSRAKYYKITIKDVRHKRWEASSFWEIEILLTKSISSFDHTSLMVWKKLHQIMADLPKVNTIKHLNFNLVSLLFTFNLFNLFNLTFSTLTHFNPLISFYTPWKHQKTRGFLIFSGGIKRDRQHKNGSMGNRVLD